MVEICVLTVSELVTNAFRHGGQPVSMSMRHRAQRLRLDVRDSGSIPFDGVAGAPDDDAVSGRGLLLVHALADHVGSESLHEDGKIVYAEWRTDTTRHPVE